ncbi:dentin sialophosphoprotein-like [Diaphorina citri]|uniref:Dentin sialophosphoprotein-like n=1 Tax=Diaphorina citri TaxID=121845 RepID=A0A3Q0JF04_DIACI|nr:dentin sialophosphoprotein-like [Diaphorina citri]
MDLLKSDWFCASEIDILSGVIDWQDNMSARESNDKKTNENDIEKQEFSGDNTSVVSHSGTDLSKLSLDDESGDEDGNLCSEKSDWEDSKELSYSEKNMDTGNIDPAETDRSTALVKSFSENVLKTLLSNVRVKLISAFDFMDALDSKLFKKYKRILANRANYSSNPEPRRAQQTDSSNLEPSGTQQTDSSNPELSGTQQTDSSNPEPRRAQQTDSSNPEPSGTQPTDSSEPRSAIEKVKGDIVSITVQNIEKEFVIKGNQKDFSRLYESEEEYLIEGLNWKVCWRQEPMYNCYFYVDIFLKCTSTEYKDWECTAQCELFWVSGARCSLGSRQSTFNSHTPLVGFYRVRPSQGYQFLTFQGVSFKVHFQSIQINGKK